MSDKFDNAKNEKKISVLGGGVSGLSLAKLAVERGASVFLSDAEKISAETKDALQRFGVDYEEGGHSDRVLDCDLVVVGSGFPPQSPILKLVRERGLPICGELDFVAPHLKGRLIGITGSNGKTTTTSLIGYLLEALGYSVAVTGNIGRPIADAAGMPYDFIVAELSSFQLHWATDIRVAGAIVTNLAPDHIDWHGSYENYVRAKAKLLSFVERGGFSIFQQRDSSALRPSDGGNVALSWLCSDEPGEIVLSESERSGKMGARALFSFDETDLLGAHNMENVAMALAAIALVGADADKARALLKGYVPPPHRCALVTTVQGVRYIDDSKGTNIAATVTALSSIPGKKIAILGGKGKGEDYNALVAPLREQARWAVLIGEESPKIAAVLKSAGYTTFTEAAGMEEAVKLAAARAEAGDVVLLSPACTSWDMYKNYGERGDHFARIVRMLAGEGSI